jgi:hypothetical protein
VRESLALLERICFLAPSNGADADGASASFTLTNRGKLFGDMPFSQRYAHFVFEAHKRHDAAKLAAIIASVLTAPGSIFFYGGKAARDKANQRKMELAASFQSDLLMCAAIFEGWVAAGSVAAQTSLCLSCSKTVSAFVQRSNGGCRSCLQRYAQSNGLNNKTLSIVQQNVTLVLDTLCGKDTARARQKMGADDGTLLTRGVEQLAVTKLEVVGTALLAAFPEQVWCEALMPGNLSAGLLVLNSQRKGILDKASALAQRISSPTLVDGLSARSFVLCMSLQQSPNGELYLDGVHPVRMEWASDEENRQWVSNRVLDIVSCYRRNHINERYRSALRREFSALEQIDRNADTATDCAAALSEDDAAAARVAKLVVCRYYAATCTVEVFGPRAERMAVRAFAERQVEALLTSDLEYEDRVAACDESVSVTVNAGLIVQTVESVGTSRRVRFGGSTNVATAPAVLINSQFELCNWLLQRFDLLKDDGCN